MTVADRDVLGRVVRKAWILWAQTQPDPKPSWLVPYEQLSEDDKEADRQIAMAVLSDLNARRIWLIEKKNHGIMTDAERAEFTTLQKAYFEAIDATMEKPSGPTSEELDRLEKRLQEK